MARRRKKLPSPKHLREAVALLRAVSHEARLLVLLALREGPQPVGKLQDLAGLEQSAMSHQLRTLRDARLVRTERRGKQVLYSLHDHHVVHILEDALTHVAEA
jgi:DNA-binding transcriptional ArsR family regulator